MYKKLLTLVNYFIYLRQGAYSRYYEGKLIEVTPDTITLQSYDDNGNPDSTWVIATSTISEFMVGDRELDELNIRVSLAKTMAQEEERHYDGLVETFRQTEGLHAMSERTISEVLSARIRELDLPTASPSDEPPLSGLA